MYLFCVYDLIMVHFFKICVDVAIVSLIHLLSHMSQAALGESPCGVRTWASVETVLS